MKTEEFNKKYKDYLEEGFYGLDINDEKVVDQLDLIFESMLTEIKGFKYSQIKMKFGYPTVYTNLEPSINMAIEKTIELVLKKNKK